MKKILFTGIFLFGLFIQQSFSQQEEILMTIGDVPVSKEEFIRIYKKNNTVNPDGQAEESKSVEEYLDLFVNFKLKVIEAENQGLDTLASFKKELSGYRKQLAKSYFVDESVVDSLIEEAYLRLQSEVRASHILFTLDANAAPEDTLRVYKKAMSIRKYLLKGKDFAELANAESQDPSADRNGGDLGYFTAFRMIYPFESAAYNTPVGEISMPVRTRFGYHVIKVTDKREARGKVKIAHIWKRLPKESTDQQAQNIKDTIFMIYDKLQKGEDFSDLSKQYSDDRRSAESGGEIPWFGTGEMIAPFENAAFNIEKKGDFCEPVQTSYGWHILKLIDKKGLESFNEKKEELKKLIGRDERAVMGKKAVIAQIKQKRGFEDFDVAKELYPLMDTSIFEGRWDAKKAAGLDKPMFRIGEQTVNQQDFIAFITKNRIRRKKVPIEVFINQQYEKFTDETIIKYEEDRLEQFYPDFKFLMKEYHDGILLFDLTDKEVWTKAVKDTTGLEAFYEKKKTNYMWDDRIDASIFTYKNEKALKAARKVLSKKKQKLLTDDDILALVNKKDSTALTLTESKKYSKGDNTFIDEIFALYEKNKTTKDNIYTPKSGENIIVIVNKKLAPESKLLEEIRGIITADYQNLLEEEWIKSLRNKYSVEVDKEMLKQVK